MRKCALFCLALFLLINCAASPKYRSDRIPRKLPASAKTAKPVDMPKNLWNAPSLQTLYGKASWYGPKFHGRKTANGEVYNMYSNSAAHKELPFNTWIRVTNLKNNKVIVTRVNDRGPFIKGRILDLSYGAAKELDMLIDGVVDIKIEVVQWGSAK